VEGSARGSIRRATPADAADLLALYEEFHAFHVAAFPDRLRIASLPTTVEAFADQLAPILSSDEALLIVFVAATGELIGLAEAYLKHEPELDVRPARRFVHLQSLIVTERNRRSGAGSRLMTAVETWAGERHAAEVDTDIWEFEAGPLDFYERLGYRVLRRTLVKPVAEVA
jgi:GNAT superfamily N-acetyltransferase